MPPKIVDAADKTLDRNHALLFKQLLQNYETKEYKKGLKNADQILKRYSTHGETLAMKGLILTNVNKKEEGWECVRKGLRNDLKSHICWHVYGLLYRAERNYEESMKCYLNALKFDPDNLVVLRDLAVIQSQLRVYRGLVETRRSLVKRQPEVRGHHTALAVSHHLNKDYVTAEKVLRLFDEQMVVKPKNNPEHSMTTLYHNTIIAESGETERALKHLLAIEDQVLDKLEIMERKATYNLKLKQFETAKSIYESLLDLNPDCYRYYIGLDQACQYRDEDGKIMSDKIEPMTAAYSTLQKLYPKSSAAKRMPLDWLDGEAFKTAVDKYLRVLLQKGVPSTFVDVKALYKDKDKADTIEQLAESYIQNLRSSSSSTLDEQPNGVPSSTDSSSKEAPTSYLWTLYFLAQSYDRRRNLTRATELIDEALAHTPTLVELHLTKARILKHSGAVQLAAEQMNVARELDLQDRFINTKSTKYYLRADQNGEAINTISLFLNSTLGGGSIGDLQEMQSVNFLVEDGLSYARQSLFGLALKRFESVKKSLDQWFEDEFDFHQYSFRKGTIDAYVKSMTWEDTIYRHHVYRRAAEGAVRCLIQLHKNPELKQGPLEKEGVTDAEKKKEKKRIQKIRARCAKDATKEAEKKDGIDMHRKLDLDPVGDKLVATATPLEDALTYLNPWLRDAPEDPKALELVAEVYIEQSELLKAKAALEKLDDRQCHYLLYRLRSRAESSDADANAELKEFIQLKFQEKSIAQWNEAFLQSAVSTNQLLAGLFVLSELPDQSTTQIESIIFKHDLSMTLTTLQQARDLLALLQATGSTRTDEFWSKIKTVWTNAEE